MKEYDKDMTFKPEINQESTNLDNSHMNALVKKFKKDLLSKNIQME